MRFRKKKNQCNSELGTFHQNIHMSVIFIIDLIIPIDPNMKSNWLGLFQLKSNSSNISLYSSLYGSITISLLWFNDTTNLWSLFSTYHRIKYLPNPQSSKGMLRMVYSIQGSPLVHNQQDFLKRISRDRQLNFPKKQNNVTLAMVHILLGSFYILLMTYTNFNCVQGNKTLMSNISFMSKCQLNRKIRCFEKEF